MQIPGVFSSSNISCDWGLNGVDVHQLKSIFADSNIKITFVNIMTSGQFPAIEATQPGMYFNVTFINAGKAERNVDTDRWVFYKSINCTPEVTDYLNSLMILAKLELI